MSRKTLLSMTSVIALAALGSIPFAGAALAQSGSIAPQTSAASNDTGLEEIVVTAQKRSENLQAVAATVSVVNAQTLQARGITDMRGLNSIAPMLSLNQENSVTQIFIRGIGQTSDAETNEPAVAANMDGVYTPRFSLASSMFDVDRVEVLSGPQGTLYGRNAAGGAINVTTKAPGDQYGGDGFIEGGNYALLHAFAAVNIPLTGALAVRAAVDSIRQDGYMSNGLDGLGSTAGRISALYKPTDAWSVLVRGEYQRAKYGGDTVVNHPYVKPSDPWYQPAVPGENFFADRRTYKTNAEIKYNFGTSQNVSLTYIPAFIYYNLKYRTQLGEPVNYFPNPGVAGRPLAGFAAALDNLGDIGRQTTQELRLAGDGAKLKWVVGLYYYHLNAKGPGPSFEIYNPAVFAGGPFQPYQVQTGGGQTDQTTDTKSGAAFGQATYSLTDRFRITAGLRYSSDDKSTRGLAQTLIPIANLALPPIRYSLKLSDNRFDYKFGVEADITDDSMAYAAIQTGYIGGGFNVTIINSPVATFKPEELLAYTVGIKNTFLDRRLRFNVEAFYYDYRQLQVSAFNLAAGGGVAYNIPKSTIYGAQFDLTFRVLPNTIIDANIGYLHAEIKSALLPPATVYSCGPGSTIPLQYCSGNNLIDYSGYTLPNSPEWSGALSILQTWDLPNDGTVEGRLDGHFETESWGLFSHLQGLLRPAYAKVDASLTYRAPEGRWSVGAWIKNIGDVDHLITPATTSVYGLQTFFIEPPRTYGLRVGYNF